MQKSEAKGESYAPLKLAVVADVVFDGGGHALRLYTRDVGRGDGAAQVRVLSSE